MNKIERLRILEKLRDLSGCVARLSKEVQSVPVQGAELVREDLEGRGQMIHGQRHRQPKNDNKITPPAGMGIHSNSPNVGPFYREDPRA
jgi:hypothetical protein